MQASRSPPESAPCLPWLPPCPPCASRGGSVFTGLWNTDPRIISPGFPNDTSTCRGRSDAAGARRQRARGRTGASGSGDDARGQALLASLDDAGRGKIQFAFDSEERFNWHFIPRTRLRLTAQGDDAAATRPRRSRCSRQASARRGFRARKRFAASRTCCARWRSATRAIRRCTS